MMKPQHSNHAVDFALLALLATLWGASYTFIKLGVATIPPITLIAARTMIAGVLLLIIMRWRGLSLPMDAASWRRFLFQACLNSVIPFTLIAWAETGFHHVRAAARLHIHRNTLIYRLDKAGTRTGRNPREPGEGLRFYLACLAERLEP